MKFLTRTECQAYAKRFGRIHDILDRRKLTYLKKKVDFLYQSPLENSYRIADELVSHLGTFSSSLLWTYAPVFGDRIQDSQASRSWQEYGQWRKSFGATEGLFDLPGQLFEGDEQGELARGIEWTIHTGSDAIIIPQPTPTIIHLSHDDLISVHSRSTPVGLHALDALGLRRLGH